MTTGTWTDEPVPFVPTEKATEPDIRVGDIVTRSAKGKRFIVDEFWDAAVGVGRMASLKPVEGYTSASHPVAQLTLVERPGATP